jgi:23S rRNA (guanine745-N1)-methyltransferase
VLLHRSLLRALNQSHPGGRNYTIPEEKEGWGSRGSGKIWNTPIDVTQHLAPPLACPVRSCGRQLARSPSGWTCSNGHTFDVARSGYVNLLQPQDRRSVRAGDPASAIEARARLLAAGVGSGLLDRVASLSASLSPGTQAVVVELGCGSGEMLGRLVGARAQRAIGIDLAVTAVARAARAWPEATWVVANADRRLPFLDGSVDLVLTIHARRNPVECARVLRTGGWLIAAVPAPDDLVELREAVFGKRVDRQRATLVIAEHDRYFSLENRLEHRERRPLDTSQLNDILTGTYRGARHASHEQRAALESMTVTLASDILLFRSRGIPA